MEDIKDIFGIKKFMSKIFICVPTMNDFEYLSTIERAYDYAKDPDNLSIATTIFWKSKDIHYNKKPFFLHIKESLDKNFKKVKYDIKPWSLYPGVGYGRISPTKHFNNEKYFLSIDSHMDFVDNWDEKAIELYENSRKSFGKLRVLTTYLTPYKHLLENDEYHDYDVKNTVRNKIDKANRWQFFDFYKKLGEDFLYDYVFPMPNDKNLNEEDYGLLSNHLIDNEYIPAKKISAHFYFTESNPWLTKYNLNLDRRINFWAEEFYQSSLSYARGYNLVWYKTQILFHQYETKNNGRGYENFEQEEYLGFDEKNNIYKDYIKESSNCKINNTRINIDDNAIIYELFNRKGEGFGYLPRSIKGFLSYSGIDLTNKKTSPWWKVPEINVVYK
jgi:hypothetical protein